MARWFSGNGICGSRNSELDASAGVILLPFLGFGAAEYNVDGGYTCSVSRS